MKVINEFLVVFGTFMAGLFIAMILVNVGLVHDCEKNGKTQLVFGGSLKCEVSK